MQEFHDNFRTSEVDTTRGPEGTVESLVQIGSLFYELELAFLANDKPFPDSQSNNHGL
jgi:hypothetical protein